MAMFEVEIVGMDAVLHQADKLITFDPHRLITIAGNHVRNQSVNHFQKEAGPNGKWAPLAASTKTKKRGGNSAKILSNTGKLRSSISASINGLEAEIGTNVFYGKYHQKGTRKMVAREFLGMSPGERRGLETVIDNFLKSLV